ncbi:MAG TPA: hypothetical protein VF553_10025 [Pyrinomonadaceae bacterium]|jgi:hypothetical protein
MKRFLFSIALAACALLHHAQAQGQTPAASPAETSADTAITPNGVIGEVTAIDAKALQMNVRTDAGAVVQVVLNSATSYLRIPPGEKTLDKATKITLADVGVGDRVFARGKTSDDRKTVPARALIVMSKADIAQKQERDRAEWRRRGILGVITALNPQTKEVTLSTRTREGVRPLVVDASAATISFRRYAPDSIKFSDARQSSFAELKIGDQLRALGERSADGTRFTPEEIVSGSFRTVGGTVTAVSAQAGEIKINDLLSKQPITIVVRPDTLVRSLPPEMAAMVAQRMQGGGGGTGAGGGGGGGRPQGEPGGEGPGAGGGAGGRPRAGGGFDFQEVLDRLPPITIAELKTGDTIIVSSTTGAVPTRVTAIALVSGVDTLLNMMQARQAAAAAPAGPNPGASNPGPAINFGIGLP